METEKVCGECGHFVAFDFDHGTGLGRCKFRWFIVHALDPVSEDADPEECQFKERARIRGVRK